MMNDDVLQAETYILTCLMRVWTNVGSIYVQSLSFTQPSCAWKDNFFL